ncbi:MAG: hypothetical protein WD066_00410 [Planctomycetaceae bacterium]
MQVEVVNCRVSHRAVRQLHVNASIGPFLGTQSIEVAPGRRQRVVAVVHPVHGRVSERATNEFREMNATDFRGIESAVRHRAELRVGDLGIPKVAIDELDCPEVPGNLAISKIEILKPSTGRKRTVDLAHENPAVVSPLAAT